MHALGMLIYWIVRLQLWAAVASGVALCGFVFTSAVMRYFLNTPWNATEEIVGFLFHACIFLCLPATTLSANHIRLTLAERILTDTILALFSFVSKLILITVLAILIYYFIENANFTAMIGAKSEIAKLNLYPWMLIAPFCMGTMLVTTLYLMLPGRSELPELVPGLNPDDLEIE